MRHALCTFGIASSLIFFGCGGLEGLEDSEGSAAITALVDPAFCSESAVDDRMALECLPEAFVTDEGDLDVIGSASGALGLCPRKTMDAPGECWCLSYGQYYTTGRVCTFHQCAC